MTRKSACASAASAAVKGALSEDDIAKVIASLDKEAARLRRENPALSLGQSYEMAARRERARTAAQQAAFDLQRVRAAEKMLALRDFAATFKAGEEADVLTAINAGVVSSGRDRGASVWNEAHAIEGMYFGELVADLRAAGVEGRVFTLFTNDTEFQLKVAKRMAAMRSAATAAELDADPAVQAVAQAFVKQLSKSKGLLNAEGAAIADLPGYIARQSHDPEKMSGGLFRGSFSAAAREEAYGRWRETILKHLDAEQTFADIDDPAAYLRAVWQAVITGRHTSAESPRDAFLTAVYQSGSRARSVSQPRVLHFKSPEDWFAYHQAFGQGTFFQTLMAQLRHEAQSLALMRRWGPHPKAAWEAFRAELADQATKRGDVRAAARVNAGWRQKEFDLVNGLLDTPESGILAFAGRTLRVQQILSKLGGIVISALPDLGLRAAALRHRGVTLPDAYTSPIKRLASTMEPKEYQRALDVMGAGFQGMIGALNANYAEPGAGRTASLLTDVFFRVNGFSLWNDTVRRGVAAAVARQLAMDAGKGFGGLDPLMRQSLERFGIGAKEWDAIRAQATSAGPGTPEMISPEVIDAIPDDVMDARARADLRIRLQGFITEAVHDATTEPDARTKLIVTWGQRPGTALGEAARIFMQFKSFGVAAIYRHCGRELKRASGPQRVQLIAHLVIATTLLGAASMVIGDLVKGREPRKFDQVNHWTAAMIRGGGAGIYGDFVLADTSRFGASIWQTAAGPGAQAIDSAYTILKAVGGGEDASAQAVRAAIRETPFLNLFYLRQALDAAVLYQLQESMNPGYLRRMEQRLAREQGQRFLNPPSQTIPTGGGSRVLEGVRE